MASQQNNLINNNLPSTSSSTAPFHHLMGLNLKGNPPSSSSNSPPPPQPNIMSFNGDLGFDLNVDLNMDSEFGNCCSNLKEKERDRENAPSSSSYPPPLTCDLGFDLNVDLNLDLQLDSGFSNSNHLRLPQGKPISSRIPDEMVGDVLQVWEQLWRFREVLKVELPSSFEEFEIALLNPWSSFSKLLGSSDKNYEDAQHMLLNVLIRERYNSGVSKAKDSIFFASNRTDKEDLSFILLNELTWPELARRYILTSQYIDSNLEYNDITSCKGERHVFCVCGDGGVFCGSASKVALKETYALILKGAIEDISGCTMEKGYVLPFQWSNKTISRISFKASTACLSDLPEWAQQLIPVQKLRTNVGSKIRNCVDNALALDPPDWAKEILEYSKTKEVYKSNAAGPTKRIVISVLSELNGALNGQPDEEKGKGREENRTKRVTDLITEKCRSVLHDVIARNNVKGVCGNLSSSFHRDDNALESPPTVSLPLEFDAIYLKLSNGDYSGSYQAFLEDVREIWNNMRVVCKDEPESVQLAGNLCKHFELLYKKEVLPLVEKLSEASEGVCKACGIDKDDEKVLLCDTCDSEYHTYCLKPPRTSIPKGNWYCPTCSVVRGQSEVAYAYLPTVKVLKKRRYREKEILILLENLKQLASSMEVRDYWEFRLDERILLLRFLCDEFLDSSLIHDTFDECGGHISSTAPRREFLGRDSAGRLYWIFRRLDTDLQLVVDNTMSVQNDMQGSWVFYKSKAEIEGVVNFLRDSDSTVENLKQAIMQLLTLMDELSPQYRNSKLNFSNLSESSSCNTKAFSLLDAKYGPYMENDFTITTKSSGYERRLFRCECLEPIWHCRHHCFACHKTFSAVQDLEDHIQGNCVSEMDTEESRKKEVKSSSCKPVSGRTTLILRLFKIDLLDMEAALPEEAFMDSKLKVDRCVWRRFVKSARTLYEMIQAAIVLENMISPKYFKSRCWYWSSLVGSTNISAVALCIYSLDAAIIYSETTTDSFRA